jgi:hypothetical protein
MTLTTDTVPVYPILYGMGDAFLNSHADYLIEMIVPLHRTKTPQPLRGYPPAFQGGVRTSRTSR